MKIARRLRKHIFVVGITRLVAKLFKNSEREKLIGYEVDITKYEKGTCLQKQYPKFLVNTQKKALHIRARYERCSLEYAAHNCWAIETRILS
jgi:hypothetical protein